MNYKAIGLRIQRLRKQKRLTQEQLAEKVGISLSFLGHIERGSRKMSMETLHRLAVTLGCTTDHLLGLNHAPKPAYQQALERISEWIEAELSLEENAGDCTIHNQDFT